MRWLSRVPAMMSPMRTTIAPKPNPATYFSRRDITEQDGTNRTDVRFLTQAGKLLRMPQELTANALSYAAPEMQPESAGHRRKTNRPSRARESWHLQW